MKECRLCHKLFEESHFNQTLCNLFCKWTSKRLSQKKYKKKNIEKIREYQRKYQKTENGHRLMIKAGKAYRKTEKFKWLQKQYKYLKRNNHAGKIDIKTWKLKLESLNYTCQECGVVMKPNEVTIDHTLPLSRGGGNNIENLQPFCRSCNCSKGAKIIVKNTL